MRGRVVLTVLALAAGTARAEDGKASTWVRLDGFSSSRSLDDEMGDGSISLGLKDSYDLGSSDRLRFDGQVRVDPRGDRGDLPIAEALWQHSGSWLDLRIGQQRIAWGKADGLNPTDFFTPHDLTALQPFEADQRRSIPAIRADAAITDDLTLSLVLQPLFIETRLPTPPGIETTTRDPDGVKQAQVGARLSQTTENIDWSVSAFHGYVKVPLVAYELTATGPALFFHYPMLDGVGADVAHNFGSFGFRAEAAWLEPHSEHGWTSIRHQGFMVAGVDRGGDDWNVNVQGIARFTPGVHRAAPADPADPMAVLDATVASQNAVNYGQVHTVQLGFTSRLARSWRQQTLTAELLAVGYFQPATFLLRPMVGYAVTDASRLTVGGEYYVGPDDSFFGQFKKNHTAFVELQHFF